MFADDFVNKAVAVAFKELTFNNHCLAYYKIHNLEQPQKQFQDLSCSTVPTDSVQKDSLEIPELFTVPKCNSELPPYLCTAPLYTQAFDWLFERGYNLHDYFIAKNVSGKGIWGCNIYSIESGDRLWADTRFQNIKSDNQYEDLVAQRRQAWNCAIYEAIRLISIEACKP